MLDVHLNTYGICMKVLKKIVKVKWKEKKIGYAFRYVMF